jgi:hypothetical protein
VRASTRGDGIAGSSPSSHGSTSGSLSRARPSTQTASPRGTPGTRSRPRSTSRCAARRGGACATPASSGRSTTTSVAERPISSDTPKKAAAQPALRAAEGHEVDRRVLVLRLAVLVGGQRHRQGARPQRGGCPQQRPPGSGPGRRAAHDRPERDGAEDPEVHRHGRRSQLVGVPAQHERRYGRDQHQPRREPLQHAPGDEQARHRRPGRERRASHEQRRVEHQQPPRPQARSQLHGEHCAERVRGLGHPARELQRTRAQSEILGDELLERLDRHGQHEVRGQRQQDEEDGGGVVVGERPTESHRPVLPTTVAS